VVAETKPHELRKSEHCCSTRK